MDNIVCMSAWFRGETIFQPTGQLLVSVLWYTSLHPVPLQRTRPPGDQAETFKSNETHLHPACGDGNSFGLVVVVVVTTFGWQKYEFACTMQLSSL
jgi:hypothetical protein